MVQSVGLSVRLPVCHTFSLCSHRRIIMEFSVVITIDKSDVHATVQCQKSKVKVTEVKTQFNRFRTVTPFLIHTLRWNDAQSLIWHKKGVIWFFNIIRQISRSHGTKHRQFDPNWPFLDCNPSLNTPMAIKWCTTLEVAWKRSPTVFQRHLSNFNVTCDNKWINLPNMRKLCESSTRPFTQH